MKMIDLNNVLTGDTLLVHNPISLNPISWLSFLIRAFTNSYYNHTGTFIIIDGVVWFYEATEKGYIRTLAKDKFKDRDTKYFKLKRVKPYVKLDYQAMIHTAEKMKGTGYDYQSTLFYQLIKRITRRKLWYGARTKALRRLYCSEASAFLLYVGSDYRIFENYFEVAPVEIDCNIYLENVEIKTIEIN